MVVDLSMRLKELRVSKRLRQDQVAELVGVNKSAISSYENGLRQPSYGVLVRLATLYRVSTDYLLGCPSNRTLDISGLTEAEAALVSSLVSSMTAKNKILEE